MKSIYAFLVYACEQLVFLKITDTICKSFSINLQQQKYRLHSSSCRIIALLGYIVVNSLVENFMISPESGNFTAMQKVATHYVSKNGKLHYASSSGKLIDVEKFGNFYHILYQLHCILRDVFGRRRQNFAVISTTFSLRHKNFTTTFRCENLCSMREWIVESSPPITASQYSNWDYILDNIATTKS